MSKCSSKCPKSLLVFFNLFFWVSGCVVIGIGSCILFNPAKAHLYRVVTATVDEKIGEADKALYIAKDGLNNVAYSLIIIGVFVVFTGFLGCCELFHEKKCLLVAYFICLFGLVCAEVALVVVTMIYREKILSGLQDRMTTSMQNLYAQDLALTNSLDFAQFEFQCCGSRNGNDYKISKWRNVTSSSIKNVPLTCCSLTNSFDEDAYLNPKPFDEYTCQTGEPLPEAKPLKEFRHNNGCYTSLEAWFRRDSSLIIGAGIGMSTLEVFGMVLTLCLCRTADDIV